MGSQRAPTLQSFKYVSTLVCYRGMNKLESFSVSNLPFTNYFYFICMSVLATCMSVYHLCAWYPRSPEDGIRIPGPGVADGCDCRVGAGN